MRWLWVNSIFLILGASGFAQEAITYKSLESALAEQGQVAHLALKREKLSAWPEELRQLPHLKTLDLSHNNISELPNDMSYWSELEVLDISSNDLDSIPASIAHLRSLNELDAGNNEIYHVHEDIGELQQLKVLALWSNNIYYLPATVFDMGSLEEVDMRGITMNKDLQDEIRAIVPEGARIRMSMYCNCN